MFRSSRKGFTLFEILAAIIIGLIVFASIPVVFHTVWAFWNSSIQQEKVRDLRFIMSDIVGYSPNVKNIDVVSDEDVVLELYNGCTVEFSYDSDTKTLTKTVNCPQGEKAGTSYKAGLAYFKVEQDGSGVKYTIGDGKTSMEFYQKPL